MLISSCLSILRQVCLDIVTEVNLQRDNSVGIVGAEGVEGFEKIWDLQLVWVSSSLACFGCGD